MRKFDGIANSIAFIFIMFVIGLNQGMQPIAGYNYGSRQIDRLIRVFHLSVIGAAGIMATGWCIAMFLPYYCARMFTTDPTLIELSIKGIRIIMVLFPLVSYQMVVTNFFQCIGKVKVSIFLSLSRQLIFLLPLGAAALHLGFAQPMVWQIMQLFGIQNLTLFLDVTGAALLFFALLYCAMYRLTSNAYFRIVSTGGAAA